MRLVRRGTVDENITDISKAWAKIFKLFLNAHFNRATVFGQGFGVNWVHKNYNLVY